MIKGTHRQNPHCRRQCIEVYRVDPFHAKSGKDFCLHFSVSRMGFHSTYVLCTVLSDPLFRFATHAGPGHHRHRHRHIQKCYNSYCRKICFLFTWQLNKFGANITLGGARPSCSYAFVPVVDVANNQLHRVQNI